jgi:hypothetical protein
MESLAPKLKRYERLQANQKKLELESGEIQKFSRATCSDL